MGVGVGSKWRARGVLGYETRAVTCDASCYGASQ